MPVAIAMAILGATVATSTSVVVLSTIISIALSIAVSYTLGAVVKALTKKPTGPDFQSNAENRLVTARQPLAARRIIYGFCRAGGTLTALRLHGPNNEWNNLVITTSGHEIDGFRDMYFDGVLVTGMNKNAGGYLVGGETGGKYATFVVTEFKKGTDGEPAFPVLKSNVPTIWTANHRQDGCGCAHIRLTFNTDTFPNGIPNITFDMKGKKVWDPRTDVVAWSDNAALCMNDYLMDDILGLGIPVEEIDVDALIAAANICDEDVALRAGGTIKRYTINGSCESSELPGDVIQTMLSAMAGRITYSGGKWAIFPGAWRPPVAPSLTDDDLRGPIKVDAKVSRREIFNGVRGSYTGVATKWQPTDFPPVTNPAYVAEDQGEVIWKDVEFAWTTNAAQCQRLGKIELERARRQKSVELQCKLSAYRFQVPDTVAMTRPHFGWQDKTFEVTNHQFMVEQDAENAPVLGIDMSLRESDAGVYAWNPAVDESLPPAPPAAPNHPGLTDPSLPTNIVLTSGDDTALRRSDGVRISRLKVTWDPPADIFTFDTAGRIFIDYQVQGDPEWIAGPRVRGTDRIAYISGVDDGVAYMVRLRAVQVGGRMSAWVTAGPHTVTGPTTSIASTVGKGKFGAALTTNSIHIYHDGTNTSTAISIYKNDNTIVGPFSDDDNVTGLPTANTLYYFYPYYDFDLDAQGLPPIQFAQVAGGVGTPPIAYLAKSELAAQALNLAGRTALATSGSISFSTTASGSGSGGWDPGGCPRRKMVVRHKFRGIIPVEDVSVGDLIQSRVGWTRVTANEPAIVEMFWRVRTLRGGEVQQTPETPMDLARARPDGRSTIPTNELCCGDVVFRDGFIDRINLLEQVDEKDWCYRISCEPFHDFLCGYDEDSLVGTHNIPMGK